jgi:hypothetical protein
MKLITHPLLYLVLASLVLSASCKKNKIEEKKETVTINGQTFGCRVDGEPFIADKWDYGLNIPPIAIDWHVRPFLAGQDLTIRAYKENLSVELWLNHPLTAGRRYLNFTTLPYPIVYPPKDYGLYQVDNPNGTYITNASIGGFVDLIEVDSVSGTAYGKFEFTGTDRRTGKQIKVTNGYFKNF